MKHIKKSLALLCALAMVLQLFAGLTLVSAEGTQAQPEKAAAPAEPQEEAIPIFEDTSYSFKERAADLVARMTLTQKASQICSQNAPAISAAQLGGGALNVPATKGLGGYTWWSETLHGCMSGVNYPQNTTVASTWNPDLYYQESTNIGQEIRELKRTNLNFYSPTINMHRDPRWGRNEESYSEDVYLTSKMGTAWVLGLEGKNLDGSVKDPDGYLMAHSTIKHYVANNNEGKSSSDTTGRLRAGAVSTLRMLREYYALPYGEIIRNADVSSVMTAYSYYGPSSTSFDPSSYSSYLMDTLLRQVYGFDGHITGDCDSVNSMQNLGYVNPRTGEVLTAAEALAGALAHGEDLECNGGHSSEGSGTSGFHTSYKAQINNMMGIQTDKGTFTENTVDIALHRLMTARMETGDFDGDIQIKLDAAERNSTTLKTEVRRPLVEQINREGVVMLQNTDSFLPLDFSETGITKVAIVGSWQTNGSTGLYAQASRNEQNIQAGIQAAFNAKKSGIEYTLITSNTLTDENKTAIAAADVAIVVCGTSGSYSQEDHDRASIAFANGEEELINAVAAENPNTVVVMETCGPMRVNRFKDNVKAILWSSFGGQWKNGFGDIMAGCCPSGKTTDTWFNEVSDEGESDLPAITDYDLVPSEGKNGRTYMYYNGESTPSYPFGYGLSYTTFAYSDLTIDKAAYDANETVHVSFKVKNTGSVAGKETTELYIAQPEAPAELKRPIKRLEGFQKVDLEPGEEKTVEMDVKIEDLAFFSEEADCFLVDTGAYQVQVGTNSAAAANLTKNFSVSGALTETPAVVNLKPAQVGDDALGIEQRLIFDKNTEITPHLTVSMNNEKLYGFIITDQTSNIKSETSCELPEGMTVEYSSNRPSVCKVEDGKVYTVAPGVATLTATVTYNGVTATGEAVVYVMVDISASEITVDGEPLPKFSPEKYKYTVKLDSDKVIPVVAATAVSPALEVTVNQATELPGEATVVITDPESGVSATYTIVFKVTPPQSGSYVLADAVEPGGTYVIVADGAYALSMGEEGTVSSAEVTVDGDVITSSVAEDLLWTFEEAEGVDAAVDENAQYFVTDSAGSFLRRSSSTPLIGEFDEANARYFAWSLIEREADSAVYTFYANSGSLSSRYAMTIAEEGVTLGRVSSSTGNILASGSPIRLYALVPGLPDIDFTKEEDASKYEVVNKDTAEVVEGEGVTLMATADGYEPITSGWGENAETLESTPKDLIKIPVGGDWTATLTLEFNVNSVQWAMSTYLGFCAMQGEDYKNLAGIRGNNNVFQDFLRKDGTIAAPTIPEPNSWMGDPILNGFTEDGVYQLRLQKEGTTYTASWALGEDADEFTELFKLEDTGIEADYIVIDAYKTSSFSFGGDASWKFILKYMDFEGGQLAPVTVKPEVASITVDGEPIDFDPDTMKYDIVRDVDAAEAPVVEATPGNADTTIEIEQLTGPFGTAKVTATAGTRTKVYVLNFGHALQSEYFADGEYDGAVWTILNEDTATYAVEKGKGIVLPTQTANVYQSGSGWKNAFVTSAMSNWEAVTKVVFPVKPTVNYQQAQVLIWQDDNNYLRLNLQSQLVDEVPTLIIEPGRETNGRFTAAETKTIESPDGEPLTIFFKFKKDGSSYVGAYSLDGQEYTDVLTAEVAYTNPQLALFSSMNQEGEQADTYYEYVYVAARDGLQPDFPAMLSWAAQSAADYIAADLPDETAEDLILSPAPNGCTVTIESSKPGVIDAEGKVTQPAEDTDVKLTVTVTEGDITASAEKTVKVPGTGVPAEPAWTLASEVEEGGSYVIVADNAFAINGEVGATPVTVEGDKITSEVTDDMIWTFEAAEGVSAIADGTEQYFIGNAAGLYLRRNSTSVLAAEMDSANLRYYPWALTEREGDDDGWTLYQNGNSRYAMSGAETGFTLTRVGSTANIHTAGSSFRLYELIDPSVVRLDKKAIRAAIKAAKAVVRRYYTDETLAVLDEALAAAENALANAATQEELDQAAAALNAAIEGLERRTDLPKYNVTFNFNYPECPEPVVVQVEDGQTVEPIEAPTRKGYAFSYWGTQSSGGWGGTTIRQYDFSTPVTADLTLLASWTKDWSQMYSLAVEFADYFPFGNFGTMAPSTTQNNQVTWEYNTYSGNSGKMTYNFGANESKAAYDAAVEEINARTDISDEQKAELIKEADGKVLLGANNPLQSSLNAIQQWNEQHPEGPKKFYRQHVLFWHGGEQNTAFYHEGFDNSKPLASKEVMNARIDSYVEEMFKRYQPWDDVILSWDVVNEALDDYTGMVRNGWNGSSWGETQLDDASNQSSAWGTIYRMKDEQGNPVMEQSEERLQYESEWIRVAFASAKKWKEELGVHWTLYYNDYMNSSMLYEPKMTNTLKMLKPISDAGNLEGYGMQARLSTAYPDAELLRYQIEEGLKLADEVSFSEGDVRTDFEVNPQYDPDKPTRRVQEGDEEWDEGGSGSWSRRSQQNGNTYDVSNGPVRRKNNFNANDPETMREQADYYADLIDIMLEKADEGKVGAIAIDGTSDGNTFNRNTGCQIWDSSSNEKPAFFAVIGAPNRHKMGKAIEAGPAAKDESKYTPETWAPYAEAKAAAEALVDVRIYDAEGVEAVKQATAALIAATEALVKVEGADDAWVIADHFEPGIEYVIVADGAYALTNRSTPLGSYGDGGESLASAAVTVEDGVITSEVTSDMLWTFADAKASLTAADGEPVWFVNDAEGNYLHRTSGSTSTAPLRVSENLHSTMRYNTWSLKAYDGEEPEFAMYCATERPAGTDYPFHLYGRADGFDAPASGQRSGEDDFSFMNESNCSHITLYTRGTAPEPPVLDKTGLEAALAAAAEVDTDKYTASTVKKLTDAVAAGEKALVEAKKQSQLDAAAKAITDAIAGLVEKPDLTALEAAIAAAGEFDKDEYTAASWTALEQALAAAEAAKTAETQAEVDAAKDDLLEAIEALEKAETPPPPFQFDDVTNPDKFYYDSVYWAYNHEPQITKGTSDTLFSPDEACTRGQVVTFLYRAAGEPEITGGNNPFTDVKEGKFYYEAVLWAVEKGITNGTSDTTFAPDTVCNRGQIVTFLWRFSGEKEPETTDNPFTDVAEGKFYYNAVLWAVEAGVTKGVTETTFAPDTVCTRGQVVTFLYRATAE